MARVSSHKTRQAILVVGDPLEVDHTVDRLQLFNELGEPLMMGGGYTRYSEVQSTAVLAAGAYQTDEVELYPSVRLWKIETNRPARVRLYHNELQRDADIPRGLGSRPQGNSGRLLEVVTAAGLLELVLSPAVDITSTDPEVSDFYTTVTNMDAGAGAVAVTYHYFRTE